ncbi:MAG: TetR/AcrR family transcriptional regulator [Notoacmeibacter sp.]|nr:TetR/AcrR family transcriptional regulator [Notoacmeibacter sp.]MCC0033592.1 TetR/AcrR family transcriptional regulator [Brucellaceae bacterium]
MKSPITEPTRNAILDAAWSLIAENGRLDVSQSAVAQAAGVSRQTVYLAFGDRSALLTAMVRHKDTQSDHAARLAEISGRKDISVASLREYLETWLDYLPVIYPVGILLDAAAVTDPQARDAWDDRMKNALLAGLKRIFKKLAQTGQVPGRLAPEHTSEFVWSLVHPSAWRLLVVECGWTGAEFSRSRMEAVETLLLSSHKT